MSDLFVYFDGVSAMGHMNGAIQIELSANCLDAGEDGAVKVRQVTTAHLRCSPTAAADLIRSLERALEMMQNPDAQPAGSKSIN